MTTSAESPEDATPSPPPRASDASADALGTPTDVEALHRDLLRHAIVEPSEGAEPPPVWMWVLVVASLAIGGFLLGRRWGEFGVGTHLGYLAPGAGAGAVAPELEAGPRSGEEVYRATCSACHQPDGRGLAGNFPPLVDTEWVTEDPETPIRVVLHGLAGPIDVDGTVYQGSMPAWGTMLSDEEIARVLTYVREMSNAPPVDAETVAAVRAESTRTEPWSEAELRAARGGAR